MSNAEEIWALAETKRDFFFALSDAIWDKPELSFAEAASCREHTATLLREGFRVTSVAGGLPTAVVGEAGSGGPVIAFLGEYDALPLLSQAADIAEPRAIVEGGAGHGCGHNLLGSAALMAATAVKDYLAARGIEGRVRYYGCPAEESGSAKGFMVRSGLFDDVDVAISWHPASFTGVNKPISLACIEANFEFSGRAAHASSGPELGRSALDAVELMNVGANYMREHMPSSARIHYAITDSGGLAPNVVQAHAVVRYMVRARELDTMHTLFARVRKIADGAALMTETMARCAVIAGDANLLGNATLELVMHEALMRLGPPPFDEDDRKLASAFQKTFTQEEINAAFTRFGLSARDLPLCDQIYPLGGGDGSQVGSTDVGTVSWKVPTVQMRGATCAVGTPFHSWQLVAQGKSTIAHKGLEHAAKGMAATAVDLLNAPELIARAKEDWLVARANRPFINPIPDDVCPAI
jgi:aminobenzoyl-glutamate utilization protein B